MLPLALFVSLALAGDPTALRVEAEAVTLARTSEYAAGAASAEDVYRWSVRWLDAERRSPAALAAHLARMLALAELARTRVQTGVARAVEGHEAAWYVAEARIWTAG